MTDAATPLAALVKALRSSARFNADVECAPHCILWPDREAQWQSIIPTLQAELPELLVLGSYNPAQRSGPAIWLRCAIAGETPELSVDPQHPPILYLPGVSRQDLRAVENCPSPLKPLAELQYRGVIWSQINTKDWTVLAFLKSDQGGLGLDVSQDKDCKSAMLLALGQVLDEDLDMLRGKRLDAAYFNTLLTGGDPIRDLLHWLNDPQTFEQARSGHELAAFENVCRSQFGFKLSDGALAAAARLAEREGPWALIWQRYGEAPQRYPNIVDQIRRCSPPAFDLLADAQSAGGWPQWNELREESLRQELRSLEQMPEHKAREKLIKLEREHAERRSLVWAELGLAPMAMAIASLAELARATANSLAAGSLEDIQASYQTQGWCADDAVLRALEHAIKPDDHAAICTAIRSVYLHWAEDAARHLQKLVLAQSHPGGTREPHPPAYISKNQCVLFVDGLRFDTAKRLVAKLERMGLQSTEHPQWTALPSVTATGKAAVSPVSHQITGEAGTTDFEPQTLDGASLNNYNLKKLLKDAGWECLSGADTGAGHGQAWCEFGDIDHQGHDRGWKLALHVDAMLDEIAERIQGLLAAGWSQVRVVTDHGWLLMPGGLPKIELPKALADSKWGRCAAIKPGAHADVNLFPWFWNPAQNFALADGVACYKRGEEYAHGGLSVQECLTLQLTVTAGSSARAGGLSISDLNWKGLRLVIALESGWEGLQADLRRNAGDASSSVVVAPKPFKANGTCSLVVEDEDLAGHEAALVILDDNKNLLAQQVVIIGGEQ